MRFSFSPSTKTREATHQLLPLLVTLGKRRILDVPAEQSFGFKIMLPSSFVFYSYYFTVVHFISSHQEGLSIRNTETVHTS